MKEVVGQTNSYAKMKLARKTSDKSIWKNWQDVNLEEFQAFIAVILNMGTMQLANLQEYWSTDAISRIPFYSDVFTRDRFTQIFWMLHLKKVSAQSGDLRTRIQRVSSFLEYINSKFLQHFVPGENLCVDESVVKFKGKISFITYNPNKPTKWGFRIYIIADSETGYICGILPYYGSLTTEQLIRPDLPVSSRIPLHLYKILLDNLPGAQDANRKGLLIALKKPDFKSNKTVAHKKGHTLLLAWKYKRVVTMLSNWSNAGMSSVKRFQRGGAEIDVQKPNVVINYIKNMGGVDRADQYASSYCFLRKSLKWWRKLFFWGLDICVVNSYILYKLVKKQRNERSLSHLKFVKLLIKQLRNEYRQERKRGCTSSTSCDNVRLDGKLHVILTGRRQDCKVCSSRTPHNKRHQTTFFCETCRTNPGCILVCVS